VRDTSLYLHFPWCRRKCPYCDFVSYKKQDDEIPHRGYYEALVHELATFKDQLADRRLVSVFFGGGTPSLWEPKWLGAFLRDAQSAFPEVVPDLEITVECNPSSVDRDKFKALAAAGVNRVSIGVQSTQDSQLQFLGRLHNSREALLRLEDAVAEIPRVSADLMFGMLGQEVAPLETEIRSVLETGVKHMSVYALTIEDGTQFGELSRRGRKLAVSDERYAELFLAAESLFAERGFEHYEVSNYALAGETSRHNQHYWRGGDYLGVGTGAVGCLSLGQGKSRRYRNRVDPTKYMEAHQQHEESHEESHEDLDAESMIREALMLRLRTREGVDLIDVARRSGTDPLHDRKASVERQLGRENIEIQRQGEENTRMIVPGPRWLHLDSIVADLF
jgi:putative oxygen-independent coproporphyrinogen III oxidase